MKFKILKFKYLQNEKKLESEIKNFGCGCNELWAWTFMHINWSLQYMSEGVLFSRMWKGLIGGPCI